MARTPRDTREKLPALQFYTGDWRKDPGVQALDHEHKGVWIDLLCIMNETADRGRLVLPSGAPMPDAAIARNLGIDEARWKQIRSTLLAFGVASEDDEGVFYNRRMVRDENTRRARAEAGRKGGQVSRPKPGPKPSGSKRKAGDGSSVAVAVSVSSSPSGEDINHPAVPTGPVSRAPEPPRPAERPDGESKAERRTAARRRAEEVIRDVYHLGQDVIRVGEYSESIETALARWDGAVDAGEDPDELTERMALIRVVEDYKPTEPLTIGAFLGGKQHATRQRCEAERLKRQPLAPLADMLSTRRDSPQAGPEEFEAKRAAARKQLEAAISRRETETAKPQEKAG